MRAASPSTRGRIICVWHSCRNIVAKILFVNPIYSGLGVDIFCIKRNIGFELIKVVSADRCCIIGLVIILNLGLLTFSLLGFRQILFVAF
jgi:hypothetical protein